MSESKQPDKKPLDELKLLASSVTATVGEIKQELVKLQVAEKVSN